MSYTKIFSSFDKGFFGSTLMGPRKPLPKNFKPSKMEFDSVDDLNKYFHDKMMHSGKTKITEPVNTVKIENKESLEDHTLFRLY